MSEHNLPSRWWKLDPTTSDLVPASPPFFALSSYATGTTPVVIGSTEIYDIRKDAA
jgi:hypothetical protein